MCGNVCVGVSVHPQLVSPNIMDVSPAGPALTLYPLSSTHLDLVSQDLTAPSSVEEVTRAPAPQHNEPSGACTAANASASTGSQDPWVPTPDTDAETLPTSPWQIGAYDEDTEPTPCPNHHQDYLDDGCEHCQKIRRFRIAVGLQDPWVPTPDTDAETLPTSPWQIGAYDEDTEPTPCPNHHQDYLDDGCEHCQKIRRFRIAVGLHFGGNVFIDIPQEVLVVRPSATQATVTPQAATGANATPPEPMLSQVPRRPAQPPPGDQPVHWIDIDGVSYAVCDVRLENIGTQLQDRFVAALFLKQGGSVANGLVRRPPWVSTVGSWDHCTLCDKHAVYHHLRTSKHWRRVLNFVKANFVPPPPPLPPPPTPLAVPAPPPSRPTLPRPVTAVTHVSNVTPLKMTRIANVPGRVEPTQDETQPPPLQDEYCVTRSGGVYCNGVYLPGAEVYLDDEGFSRVLLGDDDA